MKIDGGCHCGAITYEAEVDPAKTSICHCTDCQQLTGTAFRVTVPAPEDHYQITRGTPMARAVSKLSCSESSTRSASFRM